MKGDFSGELGRRMEEASLLPPDHPDHVRLISTIAATGDLAKRRWLDLHRENEQFRLALPEVALPVGLEQRLLEIPSAREQSTRRFHLPFRRVAATAASLAIVGTIAVAVIWSRASPLARSVEHVALLVAADHSSRPQLTVEVSEPAQAVAMLQPQAPFTIRMAPPRGKAELIGARLCRFNEGPLVLTRWRANGLEISIYQFRRADFGLPANLPEREMIPTLSDGKRSGCCVRLWTDDQYAYAIVQDVLPGPAVSS